MSRAFGNRLLKQYVVAEPEIQVLFNNQFAWIGRVTGFVMLFGNLKSLQRFFFFLGY